MSTHELSQKQFRSVLPHEPLPIDDEFGFIQLQGSFEPKKNYHANKQPDEDCKQEHDEGEIFFWTTKSALEDALEAALSSLSNTGNQQRNPWSLPHQERLKGVVVLEDASSPPFTKVRLCYESMLAAMQVVQVLRSQKIAPCHLFQQSSPIHREGNSHCQWHYGSRPLQVTLLTTKPMLSTSMAWNRTNPPKFRRLLYRPGESMEALEEGRISTRFVFVSGLVNLNSIREVALSWWQNPREICEAIRQVANTYDRSGLGVEVFVSNKKQHQLAHFCHVGMRSSADARALIVGLQGKSVKWHQPWNSARQQQQQQQQQQVNATTNATIESEQLFLDYAAITNRSSAKAEVRDTGSSNVVKGEPSRSECTSTTEYVVVPGLVLIPDFVSEMEQQVLLAALNGPTAPWAPSQTNFSKSGSVKRKVQHYGYVFDYETANVKRDRSEAGSDCPPLPGLPSSSATDTNDLESYFQQCANEGRGWDALGCLLERTRRFAFAVPNHDDETSCEKNEEGTRATSRTTTCRYPGINQVTVNFYEPGEGIGSHIDTPSAFGDGLISISLNGGIVMEFRNSETNKKKLVYLPPRSLVLMSGAARYEWEHMIVTRRTDTHNGRVIPRTLRVSLTLRTAIDLAGEPMPIVNTRDFPPVWGREKSIHCWSSGKEEALITPPMEREHVHNVYDAIATQWHHTRGKRGVLWPGATQFLTQLASGSIVADVGCGDGKYFPAIWEAGSYVIGSDISLPLLQHALVRGKGICPDQEDAIPESRRVSEPKRNLRDFPAVAVADCMNIPLRSKSCDAAICIAVMHHLSTRERRLRCMAELGRVVKPGGLINIQAWAMEQEDGSRRKFSGTDVFVPFNAQPKYLDKVEKTTAGGFVGCAPNSNVQHHGESTSKSIAQVYSEEYNADFDERKGLVVFKRYCHLYRQGELEELVAEVDSVTIEESGYESGNHFVILRVVN